MPIYDNAANHNGIWREKDVTSYYKDGSLYTRISSGKFEDLFVGDYIVVNGPIDRIMGFDLFLNDGGDSSCIKHHAVIVPDKSYTTSKMNSTNTTSGGFKGSYMWNTTLPSVLNRYITPYYGSHIISHSILISSSTNSAGISNNSEWVDSAIDIMSEINVYGSVVFSSSGFDVGTKCSQFHGFRLFPPLRTLHKEWFWLSDVGSITHFCRSIGVGAAFSGGTENIGGVRPYFLIDWFL